MRFAINQAGYGVHAPKIVWGDAAVNRLTVVRDQDGVAVLEREAMEERLDPVLRKSLRRFDVSELTVPGIYRLSSNGLLSAPFRIGEDVYGSVFRTTMRSFYLQRCGMAMDDATTGVRHAPCHLRPARLDREEGTVEVAGGWHDAGDYGRYMPTAALTVGELLLLAELAPATFRATRLDLPETADGDLPDTLREVRYELEWMLKMQRGDGGVYHKVNTEYFCGMVVPEEDTEPLICYPVATPDTAVFAAAMARASRIYAPYDRGFAGRLADAAEHAWDFLAGTPPLLNPSNGHTGAYLTRSDADERLWAAAECFLAFGSDRYRTYVEQAWDAVVGDAATVPVNWENVTTLTPIVLALGPARDEAIRKRAERALLAGAAAIWARTAQDPFGIPLREQEYRWASAKTVAAYGLHFAVAHAVSGAERYRRAAVAAFDWVLGANWPGRSFITGIGAQAPRHPHHRYVTATGVMVPGLVVGGPNADAHRQDGITPAWPAPVAYVDDDRAYAVNEYAIDYNAPVVVLAGWLQDGEAQGNI